MGAFTLKAPLLATNNDRRQELISILRATPSIDIPDSLDGVVGLGALAKDHALKSTSYVVSASNHMTASRVK
jgi:hypothetical protein